MKKSTALALTVVALCSVRAFASPGEGPCFQAGRVTPISLPSEANVIFSQDKKWTAYEDDGEVHIIKNDGSKSVVEAPEGFKLGDIVEDGVIAFYRADVTNIKSVQDMRDFLKKTPLPLYDLKTKKWRYENNTTPFEGSLYRIVDIDQQGLVLQSPHGKKTFRVPHGMNQHEENETPFYVRGSGLQKPHFALQKQQRKLVAYAPDGKTLGAVEIPAQIPLDFVSAALKSKNSVLVGSAWNSDTQSYHSFLVDLKTMRLDLLSLPEGHEISDIHSADIDGRYDGEILINQWLGHRTNVRVLDLQTRDMHEIPGTRGLINLSRIGSATCGHRGPTWICVDRKGDTVTRFPTNGEYPNVTSAGANRFWVESNHNNTKSLALFESHYQCMIPPAKMQDPLCSNEPGDAIPKEISATGDVLTQELCNRPFDAKEWDQLLGQSQDDAQIFASARLWLSRFSKPGGFDGKKHLRTLLLLIESEVDQKYPKETAAALAGLMVMSEPLVKDLLKYYPRLYRVFDKASMSGCQTPHENEETQRAVLQYITQAVTDTPRPTIADVAKLAGLARTWLTVSQREALADAAADKLTETTTDTPELHDLFASKINKLAWHQIKELFGLPHRKLTDTALILSNGKVSFLQLSHQAFEGSKASPAGFHYRTVREIPAKEVSPTGQREAFEWEHDGKQYRGEFQLKRSALERPIITAAASPDYASMWKGGEFRGLIVAGTNLGSQEAETTLEQYVKYYVEQGYSFAEARPINDFPKLLKDRVSGSEQAHYFAKEAHSDGDEKNLFRMPVKARLLKGTKLLPNGKRESVEIVYPDASGKSMLLSNREFGAWVREREKAQGPELIYLNSSCWSKTKATFEIGAAASPLLVNIPTISIARVFRKDEKNGMFQLVDSIRQNRSFPEIREALKKNEEYANDKENVFIFPDEGRYRESITNMVQFPIDTSGTVVESDGRGGWHPYTIEDEEH